MQVNLHCCIRTAPAPCSGTMLRCCTTTAAAAAAAASARRVAASSCSRACLLPCTPRSITQRTTAACPLTTRAARFTCSSSSSNSSSSVVVRRRLTLSAALAAASAGVTPWGRASAAVSSSSSRAAAMATAAAAGSSSAGALDTGVLVVYVTAPSAEVADSLASALVEGQLAACVNIVPGLTSVYSWKGKIERDPELMLIIKTQASLLDSLTAKVKQLHPYDEPEVIALPVVGGSASYLAWVRDSTAGAAGNKE